MNTAAQVDSLIAGWSQAGLTKSETVVKIADACLGWSYVWGGYGQNCTPSNREAYANRSSCPAGESEVIRKKCQKLNGSASNCNGCKWYPGGVTRFFDCRGFTGWTLKQVGISLAGAGATSQWNTNSNWTRKGAIADIPNEVCCVFIHDSKKDNMSHTGLYIGDGWVVHCSGEVKKEKLSAGKWSHYAVPVGLDGTTPIQMPTLRRGDRGAYVTLAQTKLIQKDFSCGTAGADGIFGKGTETAVKDFQRVHTDDSGKPLSVDGIIGQKTWNALLGTEPAILYTVIVKHLTEAQANALVSQYPGSEKQIERG